jgi:hypothetical protein
MRAFRHTEEEAPLEWNFIIIVIAFNERFWKERERETEEEEEEEEDKEDLKEEERKKDVCLLLVLVATKKVSSSTWDIIGKGSQHQKHHRRR